MAINYQQILLEMNRPQRRQSGFLSRLAMPILFVILLGGCLYAAWHYKIWDKAWTEVESLILSVSPAQGEKPPAGELQPTVQPAVAAAAPVALKLPPPRNDPISVAPISKTETKTPASRIDEVRLAEKPTPPLVSPLRPAAGPAPSPVLSGPREEIRVIDQLLANNPAEAAERLENLSRGVLSGEEAAEVGYRLGYAARLLKDENKAEKSWLGTVEKWPTLLGGRLSALALADTWNQLYATTRPQTARWDDIQLMYSRVLGEDDAPFLPEAVKAAVKAKLNQLNEAVFFGSAPTKLARYHKVEAGELLGSIANRYRVDYESIARINGIHPNRIRAGLDLKVVVGELTIIVRKNVNSPDRTPTLTWFLDGRWVREYPACVGDGIKTPAGTYTLVSKEKDPSWTNPLNGQLLPNQHPENILGSRWMAMKGMNVSGLGIHGTTVDDSVPGYTSAGCVRLLNKNVEELFSYSRIGGKVTILE